MGDIVQAIYAYDGNEGLKFKAGERINVLERADNGWWRGFILNNDKGAGKVHGWFPASYVQEKIENNNENQEIGTMQPTSIHDFPLPLHWQAMHTGDGKTYYYNDLTKETTWTLPQTCSQEKTPPATYPKRHTISQFSNLKKSPLNIVKDDSLIVAEISQGRDSSSPPNKTDSRYIDGPSATPPSLSKDSSDARSVGSIGSGGNRRRKAKQLALELTPSRAVFLNYPTVAESKEQSFLNQLEDSICDHFWDDLGESTGFDIVKEFVSEGKKNCREMAEFFRDRAAIEDLYARNLTKLSHNTFGNQEKSTCGEAWQMLKKSVEEEAKAHEKLSFDLLQQLSKSLNEFADQPVFHEKKDSKQTDAVIQEGRKLVAARYKDVDKQRSILAERQTKLGQLVKRQDVLKMQKKISVAVDDLKQSIDNYNDTQRKWIEDTILGLVELEKRETERIAFVKRKLDLYTQIMKVSYATNNQIAENALNQIQKIDALIDRKAFIDANRTGSIRPIDLKK